MLSGPVPLTMPPRVSVRPLVPRFHVCPAPRAKPELIVKFCVALVMSIPDALRVSVFPGPIVTGPAGLVICTPAHTRSPPRRTEFALVTVLLQRATSPAPGTTAPTQLEFRFRLSVLLALLMVAAEASTGSA